MKNRVSSVIPSAEEMQQLVKDLEAFAAKIEKFTIMLSSEERQRTTKMRAQGERIAEQVGRLAVRHQVALPHISADDINKDLALVQRLAPLVPLLQSLSQRVTDTILQAQSESWRDALALYAALSRLSRFDPELEAALKPIVEFFARRTRSESSAET